jgi:hypothetical protein
MINVSIPVYWYDDVKDKVSHGEPYYITEGSFKGKVEVEVDYTVFVEVSTERGWMV